jgi:hypothetical protein
MSNGAVERVLKLVSTHKVICNGELKLMWQFGVLKNFNSVEACRGGWRGSE